ncbi:MAG: hypothetical protein P1V97_38265, partial [Planctomycetota bacterium]|nr:hypothetical protein [Planctomycetota bacterium]
SGLFRYFGVRSEYEYSRVQVKGAKDFFKEGVYVEPYLGLSLFDWDVILFARHERTDLNSRLSTGQALDGHRNFLGFRFFPHPYVSLKAEVFREYTEDDSLPNREGLVLAFVINF